MLGFLKREPWLVLWWLTMTTAYSALSLFRHWHFQSGALDLGMQDQVIWHYSRWETPICTVLPISNALGDHFSPSQMLLAPLFWILPRVEILLVAQAILLTIPVFPIFLFSQKRLGRLPAYGFAFAYSIFWGIQKAAEFDFHELSIAVPLIAFIIYGIDEKKWGIFWIFVVLLMLTKENLCLLVVFVGLCLILQRQWRRGAITVFLGISFFYLELKILIPYFAGPRGYTHWSYSALGAGPLESLKTCLTDPWLVLRTYFSNARKIKTLFCLFAPFGFLSFLSPGVLLALPLTAERMLSDNYAFWLTWYHYNSVLSPILAMASADGLYRLSGLIQNKVLGNKIVVLGSLAIALINLGLLGTSISPLGSLGRASYYVMTPSDLAGQEALSLIPPETTVLAQGNVVPHLSHRPAIYYMDKRSLEQISGEEYVIACPELNPYPLENARQVRQCLEQRKKKGYQKIFDRDGWVVLRGKTPSS